MREKKTFATYVNVVLDSAESDITSVESTFSSIQPPHEDLDALRDRVDNTLTDAGDAISSMRIAARRHAWDDLQHAAPTRDQMTFVNENGVRVSTSYLEPRSRDVIE